MGRAIVALAVAATLFWPASGLGEEEFEGSPFGAFTWSFSGGATVPVADASKRFTMGGHLSVGVGYRLFSRVMLQAEYLYSTHGVSADFLQGGNFTSTHWMQAGLLDVEVSILPRTGPVELYLVGGPGLYGRTVEIGSVTGATVPTFCDPSLLVCSTGVAPASATLAKRTVVGIGAMGGIGASMSLGIPVRLFLEARLHFIWGTITTPTGSTAANGQYVPITVGFRFF